MEHRTLNVAVLCGGCGTRLRDTIGERPKCLVEIEGRPFLEMLLEWLAGQGLERLILCTGYQGEQIRRHFEGARFKNLAPSNTEIFFSQEPVPLGTAGALRHALPFFTNSPILVLNGDSFCSLDLLSFLNFHQSREGLATLALVSFDSRADAGFVRIDNRSRIVSFEEKRGKGAYLNAGIYVLERRLIEEIPAGHFFSLEKDLFPSLPPENFYGYKTEAILYDIGTPERLHHFRNQAARLKNFYESTPGSRSH